MRHRPAERSALVPAWAGPCRTHGDCRACRFGFLFRWTAKNVATLRRSPADMCGCNTRRPEVKGTNTKTHTHRNSQMPETMCATVRPISTISPVSTTPVTPAFPGKSSLGTASPGGVSASRTVARACGASRFHCSHGGGDAGAGQPGVRRRDATGFLRR